MLLELLDQFPDDQPTCTVTADGTYDAGTATPQLRRKRLDRHTCRYKRAAIAGKHTGAPVRNDTVRSTRRHGSMIWRRWSGYQLRSLVFYA